MTVEIKKLSDGSDSAIIWTGEKEDPGVRFRRLDSGNIEVFSLVSPGTFGTSITVSLDDLAGVAEWILGTLRGDRTDE